MEDFTKTKKITDDLMLRLNKEKTIALDFQKRRHEEWNDNYELFRNKVKTNRLTQRQAVNIPLMKETIKTLLSRIDEAPVIEWQELGGDEEKEIVFQEMWDTDFDELNFEGIDLQDKKTDLLYGRAFKKLNFVDGKVDVNALDIYDVVIDPLVDPLNIETARFLTHQNIFRSLREVLADKRYDQSAKEKLKTYLSTKEGIIQAGETAEQLEARQERLKSMGVENDEFDRFAGGDILLNLTEHYTYLWNEKEKRFVRYVIVYADDEIRLLKESLKDLLGVEFLPFASWGDDIETQDFWSDGPADIVRIPNKVLNIWFSQMIESRTLKNFQMHWYDSKQPGYQPQTYEPGPGRMLPAPGKPNDTIMPVEISGLEDTLLQIDFLIKLVEKGTSATAIEKGVSEKKQITLGEVQTLLGQSMEKAITMAKSYRRSWQELAMKWYRIMEANAPSSRTLYKVSSLGKIWPKKISVGDWKSKAGYKATVRSSSEQEAETSKGVQKWAFIKSQFPDNPVVARIAQKRMLEIGDVTPQELREIEEFEKKKMEILPQVPTQESQLADQVLEGAGELSNLATKT